MSVSPSFLEPEEGFSFLGEFWSIASGFSIIVSLTRVFSAALSESGEELGVVIGLSGT